MELKELPNIGYIIDTVPSHIMRALAEEIEEIKKDPSNAELWIKNVSSNFEKTYKLKKTIKVLEPYVITLAKEYDKKWPSYSFWASSGLSSPKQIGITDLWVNFQTPGTYSPNHRHMGIYSFAIWVWIPYTYEGQQRNTVGAPIKGCFEFTYPIITGELMHEIIPADKTYNGKILFFPSSLNHGVYPFYDSNQNLVRISVSGNLRPVD